MIKTNMQNILYNVAEICTIVLDDLMCIYHARIAVDHCDPPHTDMLDELDSILSVRVPHFASTVYAMIAIDDFYDSTFDPALIDCIVTHCHANS